MSENVVIDTLFSNDMEVESVVNNELLVKPNVSEDIIMLDDIALLEISLLLEDN